MQRRKFLRTAGIGGGAAVVASTVAAPAIAQSMPELKWRLASSFPKSLDTLFGGGENFAKFIGEMTDNKFQVRIFAAGEIVPGLQVLDAVQNGTVEMGHSAGTYYIGKDPTLAFDTTLPFGMNARQQEAWMAYGGGKELLAEVYKDYNTISIPCGNTGAQMGGWFRKEIKSPEDMKGLKFRIAGIAGHGLRQAGLGAAADRRRRHLSGAREGHDRCRRMGRSVRRPEARLQQDRAVLLLSRLVGRRSADLGLRQHHEVERAAEVLPVRHPGGGRPGADAHVGEVRRGKSQGAARADGGRHQAAAVPAVGDGSVRSSPPTSSTPRSRRRTRSSRRSTKTGSRSATRRSCGSACAENTFDNFMARQSAANKLG